MKIKRLLDPATIQQIQQTGEVEFELTAEEMRKAYQEEQHNYRLCDAEAQFKDYYYRNFGPSDDFAAETRFIREYGVCGDDVVNINSSHYLLERFLDTFERCHDCNNADNDAWEAAIIDTLEEYAKAHKTRCPRCGGILLDSDLPDYTYLCPLCDENFFTFEAVVLKQ